MSLNIKDPQTHKLAQTLAEETGESMTRAVTTALEERLARVRRSRKQAAKASELLRIGRRCASYLKGTPVDHAAILYDEKGLPR
ncbi:MAG TPA: type II toxin-antitoxin system VapB family antitoxin [Candidatus Acidoferrum sp.]|nr:type II toxin-antitoxin system VapB family antitoxin [Candidatus Acidoferrum sp.]